jgi:hypothetical protein
MFTMLTMFTILKFAHLVYHGLPRELKLYRFSQVCRNPQGGSLTGNLKMRWTLATPIPFLSK